jgi:circadian clock protein KaiC
MTASDVSVVSTSIPALDLLLAGGIPPRQTVVITGSPGTGKTVLCSQIAFAHAAAGRKVVLATVASESNDKLLDELRGFRFFDDERIGHELYVLSLDFARSLSTELAAAADCHASARL